MCCHGGGRLKLGGECDRSVEGRQGIAADSNFYYVSGSTALYKYDKQGRLAAENERPFEGLPLAANHIGDIDVWNGELYAGIEKPSTTAAGRISRWRFTMRTT